MNNNYNYNQQPQQPMYQQPMYQQPQQRPPMAPQGGGFNVKALLGIILGSVGILGFFLSWVVVWFGVFAFFGSIVGLIFGILGMGHAKRTGCGKGLAITGLILGICGIFFGFIALICNSCFTCYYCELKSRYPYADMSDVLDYMFR